MDTPIVEIGVESGSFFGTTEYRKQRGWSDTKHNQERTISFESNSTTVAIEVRTTFDWRSEALQSGSQGGLYYFVDTLSWIKFVKERLNKGVFLVYAWQLAGHPHVTGKVRVPDEACDSVCLRLSMSTEADEKALHLFTAEYRFSCESEWIALTRGFAWKLDGEIGA
jgi:hypothetical protein